MRASGTDGALEHYLDAACSGLFGLERETVRDELKTNILERVREFQVMGRTRAEALQEALEEMGAPSSVSRGMREVYTMPRVLKGGVLVGVLALGMVAMLSSAASVPFRLTAPEKFCGSDVTRRFCATPGTVWVDFQHMLALTTGQKVELRRKANMLEVQVSGRGMSSWRLDYTAFFLDAGRWYSPIQYALQHFYLQNEVRFESLNPPRLKIKSAQGWKNLEFKGGDLTPSLRDLLGHSLNSGIIYSPAPESVFLAPLYRVQLPSSSAGNVYVLFEDSVTSPGDRALTLFLGEVDSTGKLELMATRRDLRFSSDPDDLYRLEPGEALVLRLTGRLDRDLLDTSRVLIPQPISR